MSSEPFPFPIHISKELLPEHSRALFEWAPDVFDGRQYGLSWRGADWHVTAYENTAPVSHVGITVHQLALAGRDVLIGGIGGVITLPAYRGRGLARQLMRRAAEFIQHELKADFGVLFCPERLVGFYADIGWRKMAGPVIIDQPSGPRECPLNAMGLKTGAVEWPVGAVELASLPW